MFLGHQVVGFAGGLGSGKSTAAKILVEKHGYVRTRFAEPLKKMARAAGFTEEQVDGSLESKSAVVYDFLNGRDPGEVAAKMLEAIDVDVSKPDRPSHILFGSTPSFAVEKMIAIDLFGMVEKQTTPRKFLQLLGTEWGRSIHPNLWILMWERTALALLDGNKVGIAVDDVRFPNEVEVIGAHNGVVIGLKAERETTALAAGIAKHASEDTDSLKCDAYIFNRKLEVSVLEADIEYVLSKLRTG